MAKTAENETEVLDNTQAVSLEKERHYQSSSLPVFRDTTQPQNLEVLKLLYQEVNSNYRYLADIRMKLLGLVPTVSIVLWLQIITHVNASIDLLLISIFGLLITLGIKNFDARNDELYDDLISRGRKIEEELGVHTGVFRGRLRAIKQKGQVYKRSHGGALALVYYSVIAGWLFLIGFACVTLLLN